MQRLSLRIAASLAALGFLLPQAAFAAHTSMARHDKITIAQARPGGRNSARPPTPIAIKEPARAKPSVPPASALRPQTVAGVRPTNGRHVAEPPMLHPNEIDGALKAAARSRAVPSTAGSAAAPAASVPRRGSAPRLPGTVPPTQSQAQSGTRRAQSLPSDPNASGTGINPWWPYHTEAIPGGGNVMVNVGTGNLLIQDDDMSVPHKGVAMAFRRTYNSQMPNVIQGDLASWTGMFGNGWTNTFDAHIVRTSRDHMSVYDTDGARYDFVARVPGNRSAGYVATTPGDHTIYAWDGACGFLWTKKSGTTYYFYDVNPNQATCPTLLTIGGYTGRIHQIIGRNRNAYLTFTYSWDNGDASINGKVNTITVQAESGLKSTLTFADVNGRRLLQQLTFPDSATNPTNPTTVQYAYDANGNLQTVSRPPNSYSGTRPIHLYLYQAVGSDFVMWAAASPRLYAACGAGNCYGDGGVLWFGYSGATAATSTVASIQQDGVVNPTIADGSNGGPIQGTAYPTITYVYNTESFTTGVTTPTLRDTAGHMVNWVVDGLGRPVQTQICVVTPSVGTPCPSQSLLVANETWDTNNNLTQTVNARGGESDMAYDAGGNVVAIAQPRLYDGQNRPTALIDYDGFNNVVAICDPALVHSTTADWAGQYSAGLDNYCSSSFPSGHSSAYYNKPSWEPYGELASVTSASGYTRSILYDLGPQGGLDYGLPTGISGAAFQQFDQSARQPSMSASYDTNGNIVCVQTDVSTASGSAIATSVMTYDSLNRLLVSADPDDASLTGSCSGKAAGIPGSAIVTTRTYYSDGALATTRTPSESARSVGTVYTYDLDGNLGAEAPYSASPQSPQTARTKRWFDGVGRLVETQEPADPGTAGDIPISLRYLYDLSQGGSAITLRGTGVTAHGNLFDVLKNTPTGWIDFQYSVFDSADRVTTAYAFAPCPAQTGPPATVGAIYCSQAPYATRYDWDSSPTLNPGVSAPGLVVATLDGTGVARMLTYNGMDLVDTVNFGDGVTAPHSYYYDFDARIGQADQVTYSYNLDGGLSQSGGLAGGSTSLSYNYYPDASLARLSATTTRVSPGDVVNQPNLFQYAYRNDGMLVKESFGVSNQSAAWTYTSGGRMKTMNDFSGSSPSISAQYTDGYGRLSSYAMPSGMYGSIVYDAQGRMTQYTDPYNATDGEVVNSAYNIRGDLITRTFTTGIASQKPGFQYANIQGVTVQNASDQFDGRTGATLLTHDYGAFQYDQVGRLVNVAGSLSYDAENRLVSGDTWNATSAADGDCHSGGRVAAGLPPPKEVRYAYDGAGQLSYDVPQAGPQRYWVWNGSQPLYTMPVTVNNNGFAGMGTPYGYSADGIGSIASDGSTGLTVGYPDLDGETAQLQNFTGHSMWTASNPYNQFCQHTTPLPATDAYVGPGNSLPVDSTSDPSLTLTSTGRVYLSRSMGFTTPDYSSATPYSSARRGVQDYCKQGTDGHWAPVHVENTPYIDSCKAYGPPNTFESIGAGSNPFGSHGFHTPNPRPGPGPHTRVSPQPCNGYVSLTIAPPVIRGGSGTVTRMDNGGLFVSPGYSVGVNVPFGATLARGYVYNPKGEPATGVEANGVIGGPSACAGAGAGFGGGSCQNLSGATSEKQLTTPYYSLGGSVGFGPLFLPFDPFRNYC